MKHENFDLDAGTTEFYVDVDYYDHEFKNRTQDVAWYARKYVANEDPVLEVAVGERADSTESRERWGQRRWDRSFGRDDRTGEDASGAPTGASVFTGTVGCRHA